MLRGVRDLEKYPVSATWASARPEPTREATAPRP